MFGSLLLGAEWYVTALAGILVGCIDRFVYWLAAIAFDIFRVVSRINIFGGQGKGMDIYNAFTQRIYMILAIVMVFFFAYQMLTMIVNPDGEGGKRSSSMVKDIIISVVAITMLPLLFRYMTRFQNHIVDDGTMFNIVLGTEGFDEVEDPGRYLTMVVFTSFFHPYDTEINDFHDIFVKGESMTEAELKTIVDTCVSKVKSSIEYNPSGFFDGLNEQIPWTDDMATKVCGGYVDGLVQWKKSPSSNPINIATNSTLLSAINEAVEYYWIICTAAGALLIWFFVSYAFNLGTRAVKLAFLELIAPVPLILRIMPNTRKSFDTWKKELIKTYCDVFIRLAVIAFIVQLCIMVPDIVEMLFNSIANIDGQNLAESIVLKVVATVALLFGLLQFAKEAPDLFKAIFNTGSGFFDGLDLKPGVKSRIEGNDYLMKGMSAGANVAGRVKGTYSQYKKDSELHNKSGWHTAGGVFRNLPRDLIRGVKNGVGENSAKNLKDMHGQHVSGISNAAEDAYRTQQNGFYHNVFDHDGKIRGAGLSSTGTGHHNPVEKVKGWISGATEAYHDTDAYAESRTRKKEIEAAMGSGGRNVLAQQASEVAKAFQNINEVYESEVNKIKDNASAHREQYRSLQVQAQAAYEKEVNSLVAKGKSSKKGLSPNVAYTFDLNGHRHTVNSEKEFNEVANLEQRLKRADLIANDGSQDIFKQGILNMMTEVDKMGALDASTQKAIDAAITADGRFANREAFNSAVEQVSNWHYDSDAADFATMQKNWDDLQYVMKKINDTTDTATRRSAMQNKENS